MDYVTELERRKKLTQTALKFLSEKELRQEIKTFVDSVKWYFERHGELSEKQYQGLMKIYERQK